MTTTPPAPEPTTLPTDPHETPVYVLGDGDLGTAVARRLSAVGREAIQLEDRVVEASDAADTGVSAPGATVVVATHSDARNLLVAQLVRARLDVDRIVVLTNRPDRVKPVTDAGHEAVCATSVLSEGLVDRL